MLKKYSVQNNYKGSERKRLAVIRKFADRKRATYPQDGHGRIVVRRHHNDGRILAQCGFQFSNKDAEKRDDTTFGSAERPGQRPSVLGAGLSRQQSAGQEIQLRQFLFFRDGQPKRFQLVRPVQTG